MEQRIVVLGAGFGGVFAAKAISHHAPAGVEVEIIDRHNYFVFQPLLPEVAAGSIHPGDAVTPLRLMLPRVRTREAEIIGIDFARRRVEVQQGVHRSLVIVPFDQLVIAVGLVADFSRYPGLAEHAFTMKDVADAFRLRNHVIDCLEQADVTEDAEFRRRLLTFAVIGGGLSGVETLGEVEHLLSRALRFYPGIDRHEIRLVLAEYQPTILPEVAPPLADYAARLLQRRGIEIITGVGIRDAAAESVALADGRVIGCATIVATIGNAVSKLVQSLPLPKEQGKLVTDRFLRVPGFDGVWVLGDVASVPLGQDRHAPPTAQAAVQQADRLAANLLVSLAGGESRPFNFENRGQLASLGGRRGVADLFGLHIAGLPAWILWRWVYLAMLPTWTTRLRVTVDWLLDGLLPRNIVQIAQPHPQAVKRQRFRQGDLVFRRGEVTGPFYIVVSGAFRRIGSGIDGVVGPGGHFGDGILQGERLRRFTVQAETDGTCLVMEPEDLERLNACADGLAPYLADRQPPQGGAKAG